MGSGGGGGGGNPGMLASNAAPMKGIPIAGQEGGIGDAFNYGKFQSFLPDAKAEGPNDMATGLRPDMFQFKSPNGNVAGGTGGTQIEDMRDILAKLKTGGGGGAGGDSNTVGSRPWDQSTGFLDGAGGGGGGGGGPFGAAGGMPGMGGGGGGGFSRMNLPTGGGVGNQQDMQKQLDAFLGPTGGTGANWDYGKARGASDPYNYAGYGIAHPVGGDPSFGQVNSSTMPGLIAQPSIGWDPNSALKPSAGYTPPVKPPGT